MTITAIIERCQALYDDLDLGYVKDWKAAEPERKAVGYLPTYIPRELLWAAGCLPVGIVGGGDQLEIVKGDACFQSYICHLPRSVVELGLSGRLDCLDGMLFPATCDVIRNLSGIWKLYFPDKYVKYFDIPHNYDSAIGGEFYEDHLREILGEIELLSGRQVTDDALRAAIALYNENRRLADQVYELRAKEPWRVPATDCYLLMRAGLVLAPDEHCAMLREYLELVRLEDRPLRDNARVLVVGAFCEQPPIDLVRALECAGCYVVEDDFLLINRWLGDTTAETGEPIRALSEAYLKTPAETSSRYVDDDGRKGRYLVDLVRKSGAEGVVFAAPSFCDPALLDRPMLQAALDAEGIGHTAFKYSENTGQLQPIREQAGTFADTIKLWGTA
jgi:benzoyl-CoA reductase subunit C